ncbi:MAG: immunoglobulin-like domain-containing protein, partial [Candidatus Izemoplasmataceae bacterium]
MKKVFLAIVLSVLVISLAACSREYDAPTFSGVIDESILQGSEFDPLEGVSATDYDGNDLTSEIETEGFVNSLILGEHVITYSVTDSQGKTTTVNRFITVVFETSDPFALYNGDFGLDTGGWTFDTPGGSADFSVVDDMLVADISSAGSQWWQIQVHQMVTITEGETYRFSIEAKSDTAKRLGLGMEDTADGYAMLPGGNVAFELSDTLETYEFIYTSDRSIETAKFVIYLGQIGEDDTGTDVTINEVSIERVTLEDTDVTFDGVEDTVVVIGETFDPLEGVSASVDSTDLTSSISVVGLVKTNVANNTPYIVQYLVEHDGKLTVYNRFVEVILGQDDPSSIFNADFENGNVGWTFDFPVGEGQMSVVEGELIADLTDLGDAWWHIQLSQGGLHIEEGNS